MQIFTLVVYILTAMWTAYLFLGWMWVYTRYGADFMGANWPVIFISAVLYTLSLALYFGGT